jgi:glycosyltransferase involved in cell wall biosynthesis
MSALSRPAKVAIVHEWFTAMRGGEKCVEALCELYPDAVLFALLHNRGSVSPALERQQIRTSFVQRLPFAATRYRHYLPLFPAAVSTFDTSEFDLIISSSHCVAKGVRTPPGALHICYCYTPMRYIWDLYDDYFSPERAGLLTRLGMRLALQPLRRWDVASASRPRYFIAISEHIRQRIRSIYGKPSDVIYPPVDTDRFRLSTQDEGFFLVAGALVPYKRVDLAVQAFSRSGDRLIVAGNGPELDRLRKLAASNVTFTGWVSDEELRSLYERCTALVFPGEEDFGIVPVEVMACGKPVLAYARGGACETVLDRPDGGTGVHFPEQTVDSLLGAVKRLRATRFDPSFLRSHALSFGREVFKTRFREYVEARQSAGPFSGKPLPEKQLARFPR